MGETDADEPKIHVRQASANAHERRYPELHLMAVGMARYPDITDADTKVIGLSAKHLDALIGDRAVTLGPGQGFPEARRGGEHVVEKPDLAELEPCPA